MNKKPMNEGMKALKKENPAVAKKMGYKKGGMAKTGYNMGGMTSKNEKTAMGYAKGGMVNCGASMKPGQKRTK